MLRSPLAKKIVQRFPLSHLREQKAGFCTDPAYAFIPTCQGRASPQLKPSVSAEEISANSLAQLTKWPHYPHQPAWVFIVFCFSQHLAVKWNELGFLRCRWCADFTMVKTDIVSHKGKIWNKHLSCIWDLAIQGMQGMPLTCTGESKQITVISTNINRKLMKTYVQHPHKMKSCSWKWPSTSTDIALNSWILVAISTKINRCLPDCMRFVQISWYILY